MIIFRMCTSIALDISFLFYKMIGKQLSIWKSKYNWTNICHTYAYCSFFVCYNKRIHSLYACECIYMHAHRETGYMKNETSSVQNPYRQINAHSLLKRRKEGKLQVVLSIQLTWKGNESLLPPWGFSADVKLSQAFILLHQTLLMWLFGNYSSMILYPCSNNICGTL